MRHEAPLTRALLWSLRGLLALVTLIAVAGGAAFAFGLRALEIAVLWVALGALSAGGAGILCRAAWRAIPEVASPRRRTR